MTWQLGARTWALAILLTGLADAAGVAAAGIGTPPARDAAASAAAPTSDPGRRLYLRGEHPDGSALIGQREQGGQVEGLDAACASCHRRSGLGTFEGAIRVPPVAWRILSQSAAGIAADRSLPHVLGFHPQRPAYTRASLAGALRDGIGADGKPLSWVMPRYPGLSDGEIDALVAHLKTLAALPSAGSQDGQLGFALVATPGAAEDRVAMAAAVFERAFADHNALLGPRGAGAVAGASAYDIPRSLHLTVWRLRGQPSTWPAQLDQALRGERPFALLGGLGGGDWSVLDGWCEQHGVPLILPSIDAPDPVDGFYALHFHRGVTLEAQLFAEELRAHPPAQRRITQVWRAGDSGALGAAALRVALGPEWRIDELEWPAGGVPAAFSPAPGATLVVWLRPDDQAALGSLPGAQRLLVSGLLSGEPLRLPAAWRTRAWVSYPWELPERRRLAMNFPLGWLRAKGQPLADERLQADAWLASQVLETALADMIDAYYPEYLVERVESLLGHRATNAHYPRLALAAGQRFASKGAYLLRLQQDGSLTPEGGWRIP